MAAANETVRVTEAFCCFAGDDEAAAAMMHPDFADDDRCDLMSNTLSGRDDTMADNRTVVELGFRSAEFEPVVKRSDPLAVVRVRCRTDGGDELIGLQSLGTDDTGRRTCCVSSEPSDLASALAELDARA